MNPIHPGLEHLSAPHRVGAGGRTGKGCFFRPPTADRPRGPFGASVITQAGPLHQQSQAAAHPGAFALAKKRSSVFQVLPRPFPTLPLDAVVLSSPWKRWDNVVPSHVPEGLRCGAGQLLHILFAGLGFCLFRDLENHISTQSRRECVTLTLPLPVMSSECAGLSPLSHLDKTCLIPPAILHLKSWVPSPPPPSLCKADSRLRLSFSHFIRSSWFCSKGHPNQLLGDI